MKPLSSWQNLLLRIGGVALIAGAIIPVFDTLNLLSAVLFSIGAVLVGWMQLSGGYKGTDFKVRRLYHQQLLGAACWVVTAVLMWINLYHLFFSFGDLWKVTLLMGCIFQVYAAFRLPGALEDAERL